MSLFLGTFKIKIRYLPIQFYKQYILPTFFSVGVRNYVDIYSKGVVKHSYNISLRYRYRIHFNNTKTLKEWVG